MPRSLIPREHGAYAQLGAPLVAALVAFGASLAGGLLALGVCVAFVANESLLVVLGHRGKRVKTEEGARAKRWLAVLVPVGVLSGTAGLALAPQAIGIATLVAIPAFVLVWFAWQRRERTLAGELVAAIALSGASAPVAVASGSSLSAAMLGWLAWSVGYGLTVVVVHRVILRKRRPPNAIDAIAFVTSIALTCGAVALGLVAALPLAACSLGLWIVAPSPSRLRAVGFVLVGASLISTVLFVQI